MPITPLCQPSLNTTVLFRVLKSTPDSNCVKACSVISLSCPRRSSLCTSISLAISSASGWLLQLNKRTACLASAMRPAAFIRGPN